MKVLAALPCVAAVVDDSSTLLSLRVHTSLESGVDHLLDAVGSRNVTQMSSLLQNLVEETIADGLGELDQDVLQALDLIKKELLGDIRKALAEAHCYSQGQQHLNMFCFEECEQKRCTGSRSCGAKCDGMEHKKCRDTLFIHYKEHIKSCRDLDHFVYNAITPCPPDYDKKCCYLPHTTWNCEGPCKSKIDKLHVDDAIGFWLQDKIAVFKQTYDQWHKLYHKCRDSYRTYVEKDAECDCKQAECETRNCEWDTCHFVNCEDTYQKCWAACEGRVGAEWCKSECLEKDRKIDWSATEKIECYVNVLLESPTEQQLLDVCGTKDCFNQYREEMYKECNDICPEVDYTQLGLEGLKDKTGECKDYDAMVEIIKSWGDYKRREEVEGQFSKSKNGRHGSSDDKDIKDQTTHQVADQDVTNEGKMGVTTRHRGKGEKGRCTSHLDIDYILPPCCTACEERDSPPCEGGGDYSGGWDKTKYMWKMYGQYNFLSDKDIDGFDYDKCYESAGEHTFEYAYNLCECLECDPKPYVLPPSCTAKKACQVSDYPVSPPSQYVDKSCPAVNNYGYWQHYLVDPKTKKATGKVTLDQACANLGDYYDDWVLSKGAKNKKLITALRDTDIAKGKLKSDWSNNGPTLLMKVSKNGGNDFHYDSPYWENDALFNAGSRPDVDEHAKYQSFLTTPFQTIRMCMGGPDKNCVDHKLAKQYKNAKELFTSGFVRDEGLDRDGIINAFGVAPGSYRVCPMQRPGFNTRCHDSNRARWGFCVNCQSQPCQSGDNQDADAVIGIGLHGQSSGKQSSGWTGYFASGAGTCTPTSRTEVSVWFYAMPLQVSQSRDVLVMKVSKKGGNELAYDSKLWENAETLNPSSPPDVDEHAKYGTFSLIPFKKVKMCMGGPDTNCVTHELAKTYSSAQQLFSSGFVRDENLDRDGIIGAFGVKPGSYRVCPMQRPGFNTKCHDGNRARWGFCVNCASQPCQSHDNNDADAAIGIGLHGQSSGAQSSGWTGYFASGAGTCTPSSRTEVSVWFYVIQTSD